MSGLVRDLGPMRIMYDLLQFNLRRFPCIHDLIWVRQLFRLEREAVLMIKSNNCNRNNLNLF